MAWLWGILSIAAVAGLLWYLLIETEGVYLGRRVVIWLYDLFATRYDGIKEYEPVWEMLLLAQPIMAISGDDDDPLVLDIATGTGRLPLALCTDDVFEGRVIGVDLSRKMLVSAAEKLAEDLARVDLLHGPAERLPFPDNIFDFVTYLEALEFMEQPEATLVEAFRVVRPGGILLTTLRQNVRTMPGRIWSRERMQSTLEKVGFEAVTFEDWQEEYLKVWARKPGTSAWTGHQPLEAILRCPSCKQVAFSYTPPTFICEDCKTQIPVGVDGVVEVSKVLRC